jgi:hypothetical protein
MGVMNYWFFKRPSDHEKNQAFYYFRMMEPDFYPYPVYDAVKEQATSPPIVGVGYHQEDHWALTYAGAWQAVEDDQAVLGRYRSADAVGDTLSFTFLGTDLSLVPVPDSDPVRLEMTVDGRSAELDFSGWTGGYGEEVPLVGGLAHGEHKVQLTLADPGNGPGRVAIDGLVVRHTPLSVVRRGLSLLILTVVSLLILRVTFRTSTHRGTPC